jgi:hypothetical protein
MVVNIAFRLLLTFNATSLLVILFLVQKGCTLGQILFGITWLSWTGFLPNSVSYLLYFLIPVASTWISILLSSKLGKDEFKSGEVESIEHANNSFLPSYLGYFFVALSVGSFETLWFVYSVLFIFTFKSQALYFNPLFLLFGYEFYNIKTKSGTVIFLISRSRYKRPGDIDIPTVYRINNYTFIERG